VAAIFAADASSSRDDSNVSDALAFSDASIIAEMLGRAGGVGISVSCETVASPGFGTCSDIVPCDVGAASPVKPVC
jgi:hypothetical protein